MVKAVRDSATKTEPHDLKVNAKTSVSEVNF